RKLYELERDNPERYRQFRQYKDRYEQLGAEAEALQAEAALAQTEAAAEAASQPQPQQQPQPLSPSYQAHVEANLMRMRDIQSQAQAQFPELLNGDLAANLQLLAKTNPAKVQQLAPLIQQYAHYQNQAWQAHQAGQLETQQRNVLATFIEQNDAAAEREIPELAAGGQTAQAFKQAVQDTLREFGIEKDM